MLYDRFLDLCVEKGVSVSQALREAGISRNAVHNWKNGSMPNPLTRKKLERYFGVSLNEFMAHDEPAPPPEDLTITVLKEELELIKKYRQLNAQGRATVKVMIDGVLEIAKQSADEADKQTRGTA